MFSTLTTINGYNPIKALFLKEFWDNRRAILVTPMVITGLFIILSLIAFINGSGMMFNESTLDQRLSEVEQLGAETSFIITGMIMFSPMILMISVGFAMVFTALSVLFDERKDKSILFWKSMPVSDTQEVLVKLATVTIVMPLIAVIFALIIQAYSTLMIGSMVAIKTDYNAWELVFSNINYGAVLLGNIIPMFVMILWTLPIFTWFMLVSSFSRRSPFLLAFIIPALTIVAEEIFFGSEIVRRAIASRFVYLDEYGHRFDMDEGDMIDGIFSLLGSFSEPAFWVGLIVAAAMIVGCIQMRKRNSIT